MFDLEQFAADCRVALREKAAHVAVREVVTRAVADPGVVVLRNNSVQLRSLTARDKPSA